MDFSTTQGGVSQHRGGRSSEGAGGRRETGIYNKNACATGSDRHNIDRTGRANDGTDEGVTHTPFRPHSRAHFCSYAKVFGAPFLPQSVGDHHQDPLQDSRTRTHIPTSGINSNSREHRHGYTGRPGSIR